MGSSPSHHTAAEGSSIKCDVCQRQNKTSTAVSYCKDCEETLCQNCDNVHRNSKVSQKHTLLTGKQLKSKSQLQDTENTKTGTDAIPGQVNDTATSAPSTIINDAGEVQGRLKDNKSDGNSVPGRTKDTNSDSNDAVGGVKVTKHNPDSVHGRVKATQTIAGAVSGRVVDKNNDQSSVPGRKLDSSSDTDTVPSVLDLTVSDIKHHNVGCKAVGSVVFMPNGHIVLACGSGGLKLLDKHFKHLSQLSLPAVCACKVSDTEILVSQGGYNQIQFVEVIPKMVTKNVLTIGRRSVGLCYHNGEIYVVCHDDPGNGEVRVVDMNGTLIRRLGVHDRTYMFTKPWDVKVSNAGDKVFVTDRGTDSVTCMDKTGKILNQYTDKDLVYPTGILVDRQDNILVTADSSNKVHVIDTTSKQHKIVLTRKDGLYGPLCISYRYTDGLLTIGMLSLNGTNSLLTLKTSLL